MVYTKFSCIIVLDEMFLYITQQPILLSFLLTFWEPLCYDFDYRRGRALILCHDSDAFCLQ